MPETFNLIDEPWIEVVDHDGKEYMISILDLLNRAENFRDFSHALGTVNFAILRVILAILYRSWDSKELRQLKYAIRHWQQKWNQNTLLDNEVQKYLKKWHHRFDLRDKNAPFFQVPDLQSISGEWKN
jgi:CRISPR system CASCADE complex protein casA